MGIYLHGVAFTFLLGIVISVAVDINLVRVTSVLPHIGSLNGGTRLTIKGRGFSKDQFNFGAGRGNLGNKVRLVSATRSVECDPHKDGMTDIQITCDTRPMLHDVYYVRVSVDGEDVPVDKHCSHPTHAACRFTPDNSRTPSISSLGKRSGFPGEVQQINGKIVTTRYGSNAIVSSNGRPEKLLRAYAGGNLCDLRIKGAVDLPDIPDELYGITLRSEKSWWGSLKCKMQGTYVGNANFSYIIEDFGRSLPLDGVLRATAQDTITMFQTYAEITNVSPSTGSEEGGTRLSITGRFFDQTDAPAKIMVGGTQCNVVSLTDTSILCDTEPKPTNTGIKTYPGNRGVAGDFYLKDSTLRGSFVNVSTSTAAGDNSTHLDEMNWSERDFSTSWNYYMMRMKAFFIPPRDGEYLFSIVNSADDSYLFFSETGLLTNMAEIAAKTKNKSTQHLASKNFMLTANKAYPLVHVTQGNGGYSLGQVAVHISSTSLQGGRATSTVRSEKQTITTNSVVVNEVQTLQLNGWNSQTKINEVQSVTIMSNNLADVIFRLGMGDVWTAPMTVSGVTTVKNELNLLPSINPDTVTVTSTAISGGVRLDVVFNSDLGDLKMMTAMVDKEKNRANATLSVTEKTKGKASMEKFALTFMGAATAPLSKTASASDVETAVRRLFEVRCPSFLTSPRTRVGFKLDFESNARYWESGVRVSDTMPFCGKTSVKNPSWLYRNHGNSKYNVHIDLLSTGMVCFAYKGSFQQKVYVNYHYTTTTVSQVAYRGDQFTVAIPPSEEWSYVCLDIKSLLTTRRTSLLSCKLERFYIYRDQTTSDPIYVDDILIVTNAPTTDLTGLAGLRRLSPPVWALKNVEVTGNSSFGYKINMSLADCKHNLPLFSAVGAQVQTSNNTDAIYNGPTWTNSAAVTIHRNTAATPPVGGTFSLTFGSITVQGQLVGGTRTLNPTHYLFINGVGGWGKLDQCSVDGGRNGCDDLNLEEVGHVTVFGGKFKVWSGIDAGITASELKETLEAEFGVGTLDVVRTGACAGYQWTVTWASAPGNQVALTMDGSALTGEQVTYKAKTIQDGGVYLNTIPGDFLRTIHNTPQVTVDINNIPSICSGQCNFEWKASATPSVTAISPSTGSNIASTILTITGTGFSSTASENNVTIGGVRCVGKTSTSTQIQCDIGKGPAGAQDVVVIVAQKGKAYDTNGVLQFTYTFSITALTPVEGSIAGGSLVTISGTGFSSSITATVGGSACFMLSTSYNSITCRTPAGSAGAVTVQVNDGTNSATTSTQFTYQASLTPAITSLSRSSFQVQLGQALTINGNNFGTSAGPNAVTVGGKPASVSSYTDTQIVVTLPVLAPGAYDLRVSVVGKGYADTSTNSIPQITYDLSVTNVFPTSGSQEGGSVVTITGTGFPTDGSETQVKIGGKTCAVTASTSNRILCTSPSAGKLHKINNMGVHPVYGAHYAWSQPIVSAVVGDTARWTWEAPEQTASKYSVQETTSATNLTMPEDGFSSGTKVAKGAYEYQFISVGTFYYWSGFVDASGDISMRGVIHVGTRSASSAPVTVQVNGKSAIYNTGSGVSNPTSSASCSPKNTLISGCTEQAASSGGVGFNYAYLNCKTPVLTGFTPKDGSASDVITISGTGFSTTDCQNIISVGDKSCTVVSSLSTKIVCKIATGGDALVGTLQKVVVTVNNIGEAMNMQRNVLGWHFVLYPHITSISPTTGSVKGGSEVTIIGSGFYGQVMITMGSIGCVQQSMNYTHIVCVTESAYNSNQTVTVKVLSMGQNIKSVCRAASCSFYFSSALSPTVSSVSPSAISSNSMQLTVIGTNFGSVQKDMYVTLGGVPCVVNFINDTTLGCLINDPVVGTHPVVVVVSGKGLADAAGINVKVNAIVSSVDPTSGSIEGGNRLSLKGLGFKAGSTSVTISGKPCTDINVTPSEIICKVPAKSAGVGKIQVRSNSINYPLADYTFSTSNTPKITSLSTSSGKSGDSLTIFGTGFNSNAANMEVKIDNVDCIVSAAFVDKVSCTLGSHSAGQYRIVVINNVFGIATSSVMFTYELAITSINHSSGSYGGNQLITLTGKGFDSSNTTVTICGKPCTVSGSVTSTQLKCLTPSNAAASATTTCDLKAAVANLEKTLAASYTYSRALTSVITDVSPRRAGTGATPSSQSQAQASVDLAGTTCTVESVTAIKIVCKTKSHKPSIKTKVIVNIGTQGISKQDSADFEYIDVWSSKFTWNYNMPELGDFVVIPFNMTVLLDVDTPVLKMLLINGGSLIFDEKTVELQSENILITNGGRLQIGTEAMPHRSKATITLHGHPRSPELPIYGTKTIAVREGVLDLHGIAPNPVWTVLGATANAGDSQITLNEVVDWKVGDYVGIGSTGDKFSQEQSEMRFITAVSNGGRTLSLDSPLAFKHMGETVALGSGYNLEARAPVGTLSRNILIRGSNNTQWADNIPACPMGFDPGEFATQTCFQGRFGEETGSDKHGAQIMLHGSRPSEGLVTGRIENIEMSYVGQAFRLGRYAIHYHLNGNMSGNYVRNSAIHHSFNRAVNIHGTNYVLVKNNVVYDIMGGAFFLEDGIEVGNIFDGNLAMMVKGSSSLQNDDITPAAFWLTNANNTVINNFASGGTHFGFWYRMHRHPDGPSFDSNYCPDRVPLGIFRNNTVMSHGWFGIWIFMEYYPMEGGSCSNSQPIAAKYDSLTAWNNEKGAEWVGGGAIQFHNFFLVNNFEAGIEMKIIKNVVSYSEERGAMLINCVIIARPETAGKLVESTTKVAVVTPYARGLLIKDMTYVNFNGKNSAVFKVTSIQGSSSADSGGFTYRLSGQVFKNSPNKILWRWMHEAIYHDLDGSLTGIVGGKAVPTSGILPNGECTHNVAGMSMNPSVHGSICSANVEFARFSYNDAGPSSLNSKDVSFTNSHGTTIAKWQARRMTHKLGWMVILPVNHTFMMNFVNAEQLTNISYTGAMFGLKANQYVIMQQKLIQRPDHFQLSDSESISEVTSPVSFAANNNGAWHFENSTSTISFLFSGKSSGGKRKKRAVINAPLAGYVDVDFKLKIYKCFYENCLSPITSNIQPLANKRPADFVYWSNVSAWTKAEPGWGGNNADGTFSLPKDGDDVKIPSGMYVVADIPLPIMGKLFIEGVLELDHLPDKTGRVRDFTLTATHIFINGGRLQVGWKDNSYTGKTKIVLRGDHSTPNMPLTSGPNMGSKVIGVFGGLELYGEEREVTWTNLKVTAASGTKKLTLAEPVDWRKDEEIVIAPTGFSAWETETMKIIAVSPDNRTLTLNDTLKHTHKVTTQSIGGGKTVTFSAEVGLLTRNIKIIGGDYTDLMSQAFGARVLVGNYGGSGKTLTGYACISNVEFYHTGQEGWTDEYDPRFSIAFLDVGPINDVRPSYVSKCAFHHGFSPAIGTFGVSNLNVTDNVIHYTVGSSIQDSGIDNVFRHNLVILMVFPGTFNGRNENRQIWDAGFELQRATRPIITGNAVAGSERAGYRVDGEECDGSLTEPWADNSAHSVLIGIEMFDKDGLQPCSRLSNFTIYKAGHMGIYFQVASEGVIISGVTVADSALGIFPMILGPSARSHAYMAKYLNIANSVIIGKTAGYDCVKDTLNSRDRNIALAANSQPWKSASNGTVGVAVTTFSSGGNKAPEMGFTDIMAYQAIGGLTTISDTTFVGFQARCGGKKDVVLTTNPHNDDTQHPVRLERISLVDVDDENKLYLHRPNVKKINPSDCVDMDCDGMKKIIIEDLDGTFLKSIASTIIPQSEWEWNGDPRRGLGDYRIPMTLQTDVNGNRIKIETLRPHKGIIRDDTCVLKTAYNAWECTGLNYELLTLESMDSDTDTRRLSPIAIVGGGYLDLINGPQDHGWCIGYTCQKRLSTFPIVIATGKYYILHYTSISPQSTRLRLNNAASTDAFVVGIYYTIPQRLDVFVNNQYITPTNAALDNNGQQIMQQPNQPNQYMPNVASDVTGTNYFDKIKSTLHVLVRGPTVVNIRTSPLIVIGFDLPAMTVDDFYGKNLVTNLAAFLGIPSSKIKVVQAVPETNRRKKRSTSVFKVLLEISNPPGANSNLTNSDALSYDELQNMTAAIMNGIQLGTLDSILNVTILDVVITEPVPSPDSSAWKTVVMTASGGSAYTFKVQIPKTLVIKTEPVGLTEGNNFTVLPVLTVLDKNGDRVDQLGAKTYPWQVTARLVKITESDARASLTGDVTADFLLGFANFSSLIVDYSGRYKLDYSISYPEEAAVLFVAHSAEFEVKERTLALAMVSQTTETTVNQNFTAVVEIIDGDTSVKVKNIGWKDHTWKCTATLYMKDLYTGALTGSRVVPFDPNTGMATLNDLYLTHQGRYFIHFRVVSTPARFDIDAVSGFIDVHPVGWVKPVVEIRKSVKIRFNVNYNSILSGQKAKYLDAAIKNKIYGIVNTVNVTISTINFTEGSIIAVFTMAGSTDGVTNAVDMLHSKVSVGHFSVTFFGQVLTADKTMWVDGVERPITKTSDNKLTPVMIAGIVICCIAVVVALVVGIVLVKMKLSKKKIDSQPDRHSQKWIDEDRAAGAPAPILGTQWQRNIVTSKESEAPKPDWYMSKPDHEGYSNLLPTLPSPAVPVKSFLDFQEITLDSSNTTRSIPLSEQAFDKDEEADDRDSGHHSAMSNGSRPRSRPPPTPETVWNEERSGKN